MIDLILYLEVVIIMQNKIKILRVCNFGLELTCFREIWELQKQLFSMRKSNDIADTLLSLQVIIRN